MFINRSLNLCFLLQPQLSTDIFLLQVTLLELIVSCADIMTGGGNSVKSRVMALEQSLQKENDDVQINCPPKESPGDVAAIERTASDVTNLVDTKYFKVLGGNGNETGSRVVRKGSTSKGSIPHIVEDKQYSSIGTTTDENMSRAFSLGTDETVSLTKKDLKHFVADYEGVDCVIPMARSASNSDLNSMTNFDTPWFKRLYESCTSAVASAARKLKHLLARALRIFRRSPDEATQSPADPI